MHSAYVIIRLTVEADTSATAVRKMQYGRLDPGLWDLTRVDLVDPHTGAILCAVKPLDKAANADGLRRSLDPVGPDLTPLPATGMAPLLAQCIADYAATGLPPAYLPHHDQENPHE